MRRCQVYSYNMAAPAVPVSVWNQHAASVYKSIGAGSGATMIARAEPTRAERQDAAVWGRGGAGEGGADTGSMTSDVLSE